jgi:hypothetical protein
MLRQILARENSALRDGWQPRGYLLGRARGCPSATAAEISLLATSCLASVSLSGTVRTPQLPNSPDFNLNHTLQHRLLPPARTLPQNWGFKTAKLNLSLADKLWLQGGEQFDEVR